MATTQASVDKRRSIVSTTSTSSAPSDGQRSSSTERSSTSTPRTSHSSTDRSRHAAVTANTLKPDHAARPDRRSGGSRVDGVEIVGGVQVSDHVPTSAQLRKVADCAVYAADGTTRSFESLLHEAADGVGAEKPDVSRGGESKHRKNRVLVVFVRHFFCGNCQEYIRTLTRTFDGNDKLSKLAHPTRVVIIGCGQPSLIPMYSAAAMASPSEPSSSSSTSSTPSYPFDVYADPTQQLYKRLGMIRTLRLGDHRPDYMPHRSSLFVTAFRSILQGIRSGKDATKGGDSKQVGGEFLFEFDDGQANADEVGDDGTDGKVKDRGSRQSSKGGEERGLEGWKVLWCHRMRNTRDHTEMKDLQSVLTSSSSDPLPGTTTTITAAAAIPIASGSSSSST